MKNNIYKKKRIISILLTALLMVSLMTVSVLAAGSVTYNGKDEGFSFGPGSNTSATDVFESFKGLMPGDSRSEDITVTNNGDKTVKIDMRSIGAAENKDFISQLNITVDGSGDMVRTSGDELWVSLGNFAPGESRTIKVALEMPITVGNEYQDAEGILTWQFIAEEEDEDDEGDGDGGDGDDGDGSDGDKKTGDDANLYIWCGIGALALAAGGVAVKRRRREDR